MFFRCLNVFVGWLAMLTALGAAESTPELCPAPIPQTKAANILRVASDPNNLPFSNQRREGFENKIIELVAHDLGLKVEYTWWAQRRGFFRHTLKEGLCDVVVGVPRGFDMALTTMPYYRSMYVFVSRRDRRLSIRDLDDPQLPQLTIGVQMVGDDFMNTPPAHALSRRGMTQNIRGYMLYGDYTEENPPARIVTAVLNREIDGAMVWGPLAGYFVKQHDADLTWAPLPASDGPTMPFTFDICMGVQKTNAELRAKINAVLAARRTEIDAILESYGVPRAPSS